MNFAKGSSLLLLSSYMLIFGVLLQFRFSVGIGAAIQSNQNLSQANKKSECIVIKVNVVLALITVCNYVRAFVFICIFVGDITKSSPSIGKITSVDLYKVVISEWCSLLIPVRSQLSQILSFQGIK